MWNRFNVKGNAVVERNCRDFTNYVRLKDVIKHILSNTCKLYLHS